MIAYLTGLWHSLLALLGREPADCKACASFNENAAAASAPRVLRRELALGVHPDLADFLDWWEGNGPHQITLAHRDGFRTYIAPAGVRTDADQAAAHAAGQSNATSSADSPHGHAAAIDIWPSEFNPDVPWDDQPESVKAKFAEQGRLAKLRGHEWGGDFTGATFPDGDQPHVQKKGWRTLPLARLVS